MNTRYNQRFMFLAWLNLEIRIHTYTHTHIHSQPHTNEILTIFCLYFVAFSISFHLLNCQMNVVINFMKP